MTKKLSSKAAVVCAPCVIPAEAGIYGGSLDTRLRGYDNRMAVFIGMVSKYMFRERRQCGFTLIEILVVLSVVLILAGALLGVGKYITVRAQVQLCQSQLEVICTALEQYYDDHEAFPVTLKDITGDGTADAYDQVHLENDLNGTVQAPATFTGLDDAAPSSAALFYFLDASVNSRKIIEALSGGLLTNKDSAGKDLKITLDASGDTIDLPRFIDPWGKSIRYEYADGTAFPRLTSAGPDGDFMTVDDNLISP